MMANPHARRIKELDGDRVFIDLILFARQLLGQATHDALQRFRWGDYGYNEGVAAVSIVLCHLLATLNLKIDISPDEIGALVREALIEIRKDAEEDEDEKG